MMNKKQYLENKGLKTGDNVRFRVENQNFWVGVNTGRLVLDDEPHIILDECGIKFTIQEGYDAYIGSIQKIDNNEVE